MPKTISFHCGSTWSRGHNVRDERYTSKQKHIDPTLSANNMTIFDTPIRQAYRDIFGTALEEYNAKQHRSDRHIDDYYLKIKQDKRKHAVYECIVQIGDKDDTGNAAEQEKAVLLDYAEQWEKNNPRLKLVGAYIHADEPNGTVHMHVDFIPVAECSRGMRLQNSLVKALEQQGYAGTKATDTAQMRWQQAQRETLERLCRSRGISAQANQGLTHKHLSVQEYQREKDKQSVKVKQDMRKQLIAAQNEAQAILSRSERRGNEIIRQKQETSQRAAQSVLEGAEQQAEEIISKAKKSVDSEGYIIDPNWKHIRRKERVENKLFQRQEVEYVEVPEPYLEKLVNAANFCSGIKKSYSETEQRYSQALAELRELRPKAAECDEHITRLKDLQEYLTPDEYRLFEEWRNLDKRTPYFFNSERIKSLRNYDFSDDEIHKALKKQNVVFRKTSPKNPKSSVIFAIPEKNHESVINKLVSSILQERHESELAQQQNRLLNNAAVRHKSTGRGMGM